MEKKQIKNIKIEDGVKKVEALNEQAGNNNTVNQKTAKKTKTVKKNSSGAKSTKTKSVTKSVNRDLVNHDSVKETVKQEKVEKSAPKRFVREKTVTKKDGDSRVEAFRKKGHDRIEAIRENSRKRFAEYNKIRLEKIKSMQEQKEHRKAEIIKERELREKHNAEVRHSLAKMREEKKIQQEKIQRARRISARRRVEAIKEAEAKRREHRAERIAMLRNETREDRVKRIKKENADRLRVRQEKRILADKHRRERIEALKLRAQERRSHNSDKKRGVYTGFLTAVVILGVAVLALGSMLTVTYRNNITSKNLISSSYEKSFYDLVGYVDNLDVNLSKLQVSNSEAEQQKLLTNVVVQSELAENNIQQLPIEDESKSNTASFINSMGDYARSLIAKIAAGEKLTSTDKDNLNALYEVNLQLKNELSDLAGSIGEDYKFVDLLKGKNGDLVLNKFNELQNSSVEYPKLIYDGPFSAALEKQEPKALKGLEEITRATAEEKFKEYFSDYKVQKIDYVGEADGKSFTTYNFEGTLEGGDVLFAQISKIGGKLIMFNMNSECSTTNFDADKCVEIAGDFISSIGINNMKAVWINDSSNIATINFVTAKGDVVIYPDMIKVKVCEEKGKVLGFEAASYYLNHSEDRDLSTTITMAKAREKVSDRINILTQRLTVVPKAGGTEVAAYEFMGTYKGATYYVYINAKTGNETEVFKVIESTEGNLLI